MLLHSTLVSVTEGGFDPPTYGLWAHRNSSLLLRMAPIIGGNVAFNFYGDNLPFGKIEYTSFETKKEGPFLFRLMRSSTRFPGVGSLQLHRYNRFPGGCHDAHART